MVQALTSCRTAPCTPLHLCRHPCSSSRACPDELPPRMLCCTAAASPSAHLMSEVYVLCAATNTGWVGHTAYAGSTSQGASRDAVVGGDRIGLGPFQPPPHQAIILVLCKPPAAAAAACRAHTVRLSRASHTGTHVGSSSPVARECVALVASLPRCRGLIINHHL